MTPDCDVSVSQPHGDLSGYCGMMIVTLGRDRLVHGPSYTIVSDAKTLDLTCFNVSAAAEER